MSILSAFQNAAKVVGSSVAKRGSSGGGSSHTGGSSGTGGGGGSTSPAGASSNGGLSQAEQYQIERLQDQWRAANATGNTAGMEKAHAEAEAIRAKAGYSGGEDGSAYLPLSSGAGAGPSGGTGGYVAQGTYFDKGLSGSDKTAVESLQAQWEAAKKRGDAQAMDSLHAQAEAIRSGYGYSGGDDGSAYLGLDREEDTLPKVGLPSYTAQVDQTNAVYDAAQTSALAALEKAYNQSRLEAERAMAKIPGTYQQQANAVAANAEIQRRNFNEYSAYNGLTAGPGSQAALAMGNQLQKDLGSVRVAEANALTDAQAQITALYIKYQDAIAEAVAKNEYERAAALLSEYQRQAESIVETSKNQAYLNLETAGFNRTTHDTNQQELVDRAETLAQFGDFSGYLALGFTSDQVNNMRKTWLAMNPNLAGSMGIYR